MVSIRYHGAMNTQSALYIYLERIRNLVRAREWELARRFDLQPVQMRMLHYLGRCNRYSNTPAGVGDYVQLTKGTVSQSLKVLEARGYIEKRTDPRDRRQLRLVVTDAGRAVLEHLPLPFLRDVADELGAAETEETLAVLGRLLVAMQGVNDGRGFGVCHTCAYHRALDGDHFRCGLTGKTLSAPEAEQICREHIWPDG